jgi:hypothetical protein
MKEQSINPGGFKIQIESTNTPITHEPVQVLTPAEIGYTIGAILAENSVFDHKQEVSLIIEICNEVFERQETVIRIVKNENPKPSHAKDYTRNYWVEA